MIKKSFKYFHEGDEYSKIIDFIEDSLSLITNPMPESTESGDECYLKDKRVKIAIEIFDE